MAQPYVGEIRIFAGSFEPAGWMFCEGQTLAISENDVLFTLIGTTYGGDGQSTFNLPDLRGRLPIHQGSNSQTFTLGQPTGTEVEALSLQQIPVHGHPMLASADNASTANAGGGILAQTPSYTPYRTGSPGTPLASTAVSATGNSLAHSNLQPYLCLHFIISLFGIFPSQ